MADGDISTAGEAASLAGVRPFPDLLSDEEKAALLKQAEDLWSDLQKNDLGGFSGVNRPFYILHEFKRVIETFGRRDVGLHWSKNDLEKADELPPTPDG